MSSGRFSPLGNYIDTPTGLFLELGTPVFNVRFRVDGPEEDLAKKRKIADWVDAEIDTHFELKIPRLELEFLVHMIACFEDAMIDPQNGQVIQNEALLWFTYHNEEGWGVKIPDQVTGPASVTSTPISARDNIGVIFHSHGKLPAYFSKTDDQDEVDGFIYGVVGNLFCDDGPTIILRVGYAGCFLPLPFESVFALKG